MQTSGVQIVHAAPVLAVPDVAATMEWYRDVLGFTGSPFPDERPYSFAILCHGNTELMFRRGEATAKSPTHYEWDIYLRLHGGKLRQLYSELNKRGVVTRRLEQMFYGLAEFEITDPDGYVVCLSEELPEMDDLPKPCED